MEPKVKSILGFVPRCESMKEWLGDKGLSKRGNKLELMEKILLHHEERGKLT